MEHSSLDLSIVKKEPGFDEPFSTESGLFDNMMSDDFHDTNFHSMVSELMPFHSLRRVIVKLSYFSNHVILAVIFLFFNGGFILFLTQHHTSEEVPVDWLSGFFDEVPSCAETTLSYNSLPEYTSSTLPYTSFAKSHYLSLNGLSMDTMSSFPEECSNESLYCSTPSDPQTPDYKPLSPDSLESTHSLEADVKPNIFGKDTLFEPHESFAPLTNSRIEPFELKLFEQSDGQKSSPESPHSENGSDRLDSESGR